MTERKDLKKLVRAKMSASGESYAKARKSVMSELKREPEHEHSVPARPLDVAVLKLNAQSARVRVLGEDGEVTLRGNELHLIVPGHIATVRFTRRWTYRGAEYATGIIEAAKLDIAALGLEPLPMESLGEHDLATSHEGFDDDDPYAQLWRRFTAQPRPAFEMHAIAWEGREAFETGDEDDVPISEAAELYADGDHEGAEQIVMDVLHTDLRCIDAHAHLGNWVFDESPRDALTHYDIGIGIGELSLAAAPKDALLPWGCIYNRPFLRCLHGRALCEWRMQEWSKAEATLERILELNPPDNQGARFCWSAVRDRKNWTPEFDE